MLTVQRRNTGQHKFDLLGCSAFSLMTRDNESSITRKDALRVNIFDRKLYCLVARQKEMSIVSEYMFGGNIHNCPCVTSPSYRHFSDYDLSPVLVRCI